MNVRSYLGAVQSVSMVDSVANAAMRLEGKPEEFNPLLLAMGNATFALIGEASHGTHEFYHIRAEITKKLIVEKGFKVIAVEADWPDAYRINKYVRGESDDKNADEALSDFKRFPKWMWRNEVVLDFVEWLRKYNDELEPSKKVGFYGLDLYSMNASRKAVIDYLKNIDMEAANRAKNRYSCFDQYGREPQSYGKKVANSGKKGCKQEAVHQLTEMVHNAYKFEREGDDPLWPIQNAAVVKGAEDYYRAMYSSGNKSWNVRDQHMTDTLGLLAKHFGEDSKLAKVVVWEHNSHLGDARETERTKGGKWNVGQLARERYGLQNTYNIGFTTYTGTVTAAAEWGEPAELMHVNPGLQGSIEERFHQTGIEHFMLLFRGEHLPESQKKIAKEMHNLDLLERAIGVVYCPLTERISHYLNARIARQFDAVIHVDTTRALVPLDNNKAWRDAEEAKMFLQAC